MKKCGRDVLGNFLSSGASQLKTTIVQAGAGTGKTQSLLLKLLKRPSSNIVQKMEYQDLLPQHLRNVRPQNFARSCVFIADQEDAPEWLKDFVKTQKIFHISTIHGTLSLFLHRYGSLLGLDPDLQFKGI